jgi:hypothetical protein
MKTIKEVKVGDSVENPRNGKGMAKSKTATSEVATMDVTNVPAIISALEEKIKSLSHVTDSKYKTSGVLDGFGDIKKETNVGNLIKAFSSVKGRGEAYVKAAEDLGLVTFPVFELNGGTVEDWKKDITLRINIINHKETLDKLNTYKDKFQKFLSEEDQKMMLLQEMAQFLQA